MVIFNIIKNPPSFWRAHRQRVTARCLFMHILYNKYKYFVYNNLKIMLQIMGIWYNITEQVR